MDKRTLLFVAVLTLCFFVVNFLFGPQYEREAEPQVAPVAEVQPMAALQPHPLNPHEQFYVLENPYQQLVFSNIGGALAEINLPFLSDSHPQSVVRQIGVDRQLATQAPQSALFPSFPYFRPSDAPQGPYRLEEGRSIGGYYPLMRRSLIDSNGNVIAVSPEHYALNITSRYPEVAEAEYSVKYFDDRTIVFEHTTPHRTIRKTYTLPEEAAQLPYVFDLKIEIAGDREATKGLWLTSGVPDVELLSGRPIPALNYRLVRNGKGSLEKIRFPKEGQPSQTSTLNPVWAANSNGFFSLILDPQAEMGAGYRADYIPGVELPSRLVLIDQEFDRYRAGTLPGYQISVPLASGAGTTEIRVFAGPLSTPTLRTVDGTILEQTGQNPEYRSMQSFRGYFAWIAEPFSKLLLWIMQFFYVLTGSWGISIILLTVVLRILLYPLTAWSFKSMRRMQELAPEVAEIQARYAKEPRKAQMEIMALYKKKKANPFSGCLPLLIQMPFLIAMFDLLKSTFALRGAPFVPGWIDNLTAPDVLFSWNRPIFFIGTEFHLLPFILGAVMLLQQRLSSTAPKDKSLWTDQQRQQRMMGNVMVVIFTVMFYRFASGLNIYFISSMVLGLLQQWITNRQLDRKKRQLESKPNGKHAQV
jgi:YidC/Oxa1 family membrane protein insertase